MCVCVNDFIWCNSDLLHSYITNHPEGIFEARVTSALYLFSSAEHWEVQPRCIMSLSHTWAALHSPNPLSQQAHLASKEKEPVHSVCTWSNEGQVAYACGTETGRSKSVQYGSFSSFAPYFPPLVKGKSPASSTLFSDFRSHVKQQSFYILPTWCKCAS